MKQVTMESVKQRIADLESAGKVVGGLSLSSEFELACLRELVAVTEQVHQLTEQRDVLAADNVVLKSAFNPVDIPEDAVKAFKETAIIDHEWDYTSSWSWVENDTDVIRAVLEALKPETPATDAAIASLRAEAFNDLCKAFVLHKQSACLDDNDKVSVREATDALLHCAEQLASQLRESKGANHE